MILVVKTEVVNFVFQMFGNIVWLGSGLPFA